MEPHRAKTKAQKPTMLTAYFIYCPPSLCSLFPLYAFHPKTSLCTNNLEPSPNPHLHHIHICTITVIKNPIFHLHCTQVPELMPHKEDAVHSLLLHVSLTLGLITTPTVFSHLHSPYTAIPPGTNSNELPLFELQYDYKPFGRVNEN